MDRGYDTVTDSLHLAKIQEPDGISSPFNPTMH